MKRVLISPPNFVSVLDQRLVDGSRLCSLFLPGFCTGFSVFLVSKKKKGKKKQSHSACGRKFGSRKTIDFYHRQKGNAIFLIFLTVS